MFGAPAPAPSGGFNFGGAAPAPAPAASGFSFGGAAPAPAPASSGFNFGGQAAAAPATGFSFGGAQSAPAPAPAGGLSFGFGSSPAPAPAPSALGGFSFGGATAPAPAPTPGTSSFSFGATPAPAPAPTAFGLAGFGTAASSGTPAPAPSLFGAGLGSGGLFGTSTATAGSGGSGFGATGGGLFGAPATAGGSSLFPQSQSQPSSELENALQALMVAYANKNPNGQPNGGSRFKHLLYNIVDPGERHRYSCPPYIEARLWEQAERDNPDPETCVPAPVVGFQSLQERVQHQQKHTTGLVEIVKSLQDTVESLQQAAHRTHATMESCRRKQVEQSNRFLQIVRKIELLRCMNLPLSGEEKKLATRLEQVQRSMYTPSVRLGDIVSIQMLVEQRMDSVENITEEDQAALFTALHMQKDGLNHLTQILKKDLRDMGILQRELRKRQWAGPS